jgi:diacylglycerol kinase
MKKIDSTIEKLCDFIQDELDERDVKANDCGTMPDLITALAELVSARTK